MVPPPLTETPMVAKISGLFDLLLPLLLISSASDAVQSVEIYSASYHQATMASAVILSFGNQCSDTVWPAIISHNGPILGGSGFSLARGKLVQLTAYPGWSGRVWPRTGCKFDSSGNGKCFTGDCGSLNCSGGGQPPFTLAEFIIASEPTDKNFYTVYLTYGYNRGMRINVTGGTSDCPYAGCIADLNGRCPMELKVVNNVSGSVVACKSACEAFQSAEACSRTQYSEMFKKACPNAYSYPKDAISSRFTCSGPNILITFCPKEL